MTARDIWREVLIQLKWMAPLALRGDTESTAGCVAIGTLGGLMAFARLVAAEHEDDHAR